ncbi:ABC transporter permease [Actinoplanes sp. NPDC004185]
MRSVWTIAVTNLRRSVREPLLLFTTLALPFMIITIVGLALSDSAQQLTVGVVSPGSHQLNQDLVGSVRAAAGLHTVAYTDEADLRRAVRRGQLTAGVVVPAAYGDDLLAGRPSEIRFLTTPRQSGAATARAVLASVVDRQVAPIAAARFASSATDRPLTAELARARRLAPTVTPPGVVLETVAQADTMRLGVDYTGPSNLTLFVIITSMTSAAALVESRTQGITRRMFALPIRRRTVLAGEFLGRFLVAAAQAAVILAFCAAVFGVRWGDPAGVAVLTIALCLFGAALGILVGFAARTPAQAIAVGPTLGVALGMLGGCMWPLAIVGETMRRIGHATPNAWALDGYVRLINTTDGLPAVAGPAGVIAGMTVLVLAVAARVIRKAGVS